MDGRCSLDRKNIMQSPEVRDGMVCAWFTRIRLVIGGNDPEAEASSAELSQAIPVPTGQA